jgi:hypothetical protein
MAPILTWLGNHKDQNLHNGPPVQADLGWRESASRFAEGKPLVRRRRSALANLSIGMGCKSSAVMIY